MSGTSAHPDLRPAQPAASEEALRAVLQSHTFARAEKLQRFLKYVAEMTFRGDAGLVHEHLIAIEVFGRGDDYSPGEDSVVRRQAHALRRKLKEYYESEGESDPVQIELPLGTYVPVFRERRQTEPGPVPAERPDERTDRRGWRRAALACGAIGLLASAFWVGWTARGSRPAPAAGQPAMHHALRELWGSWLGHSAGAVLCLSNPATTSVRQFAGPIQPNPEHQGVAVTAAQDAALRSFFRFPDGGHIYLYPVMAQAKMGEALAAISLTAFFTRAGLPVQATQSRFMTWDGMRNSNIILLGMPIRMPG